MKKRKTYNEMTWPKIQGYSGGTPYEPTSIVQACQFWTATPVDSLNHFVPRLRIEYAGKYSWDLLLDDLVLGSSPTKCTVGTFSQHGRLNQISIGETELYVMPDKRPPPPCSPWYGVKLTPAKVEIRDGIVYVNIRQRIPVTGDQPTSERIEARQVQAPGLLPAIIRECGQGAALKFAEKSGAYDAALDRLLDDVIAGGEGEAMQ